MSFLTQKIATVRNRIESTGAVRILNDDQWSPEEVSLEDLKKLPLSVPINLKELLYDDYSSVVFSWEANAEVFGSSCKRGYLNLLSPGEIVKQFNAQVAEAEEAKCNGLDDEEGYLAIINDWPHWLPVFRFRSGDLFCIETRRKGFPVVFLEHDVMDAGPNLHGMQIAKNVECLVNNWASILFVEFNDWTEICNEEGIDLGNPILEKLRILNL